MQTFVCLYPCVCVNIDSCKVLHPLLGVGDISGDVMVPGPFVHTEVDVL